MDLEKISGTPEKSPEQKVALSPDDVLAAEIDAKEKLEALKAKADTPEKKSVVEEGEVKINKLSIALALGLALNAMPAEGQEVEPTKLIEPTSSIQVIEKSSANAETPSFIKASETKTQSTEVAPVSIDQDNLTALEKNAKFQQLKQAQMIMKVIEGNPSAVVEVLTEIAKTKIEDKVDNTKDSLKTMIDGDKKPGERIEASLDIAKFIPGRVKMVANFLSNGIDLQKDLEKSVKDGTVVKDVVFRVVGIIVDAHTLGYGSAVTDYLKNLPTSKLTVTQSNVAELSGS